VPETPEITRVYSASTLNYRQQLIPVICVEWKVSEVCESVANVFLLELQKIMS